MSKQDPNTEYAIAVLSDGTAVKTDDVAKMPAGIKYAINSQAMETWQTQLITQLYNKYADKPVKKFKDKNTAAERTFTLLSEKAEEFVPAQLPETVKGKVTAKPSTAKKKRSSLDTSKKVRIVADRVSSVQSGIIKNRLKYYEKEPVVQSILDKNIENLETKDIKYDIKQGVIELI